MDSNFSLTICVILMTELMVPSSLSQSLGKIHCQMRDITSYTFNYKLTVTSRNDSSVEASHWLLMRKKKTIGKQKFWIERCSPSMKNKFCENWETFCPWETCKTPETTCKTASSSAKIVCNIGIPLTYSYSTNTKKYAVFVNYNATHAWQMKTKKFPKVQLNGDKPKCYYNQTHINIMTELEDSSAGSFMLTLLNNRINRNFTKNFVISRKELKEINLQNFTANISLCVHSWCTGCGIIWSFTCYSKQSSSVSHSTKKKIFPTSIIVTLGTVGGLLFVAMCTPLFWFIFIKRKINNDLIQPLNKKPIYGEVQERDFYDETDF